MSVRGVFNDVVINTSGNALANVQVDVYAVGTTTPVTIYSGRTGGGTLTNPIITDSTGQVYFFTAPGSYSIKFSDTLSPARFATRTVVYDSVSGDVATGGISLTQIEEGTVDKVLLTDPITGKVILGQVDTAHIINDAITTGKIEDNAVTSAKIADNSVDTSELNADSVTQPKIADDAIIGTKINSNTLQSGSFTFNTNGSGAAGPTSQAISTMTNSTYTVFLQVYKSGGLFGTATKQAVTARTTTTFNWEFVGGAGSETLTMFWLVVGTTVG